MLFSTHERGANRPAFTFHELDSSDEFLLAEGFEWIIKSGNLCVESIPYIKPSLSDTINVQHVLLDGSSVTRSICIPSISHDDIHSLLELVHEWLSGHSIPVDIESLIK